MKTGKTSNGYEEEKPPNTSLRLHWDGYGCWSK